jgi:hypothetical protein
MLDYLRDRISVDSATIPDQATVLAEKTYAAAVSLRSGGGLVGQAIRHEKDLARSIVGAALSAMRSPKLPDVVTAEYIRGLTIEVEVLGPSRKVEEADLRGPPTRPATGPAAPADPGKVFVGGLTGVRASRGLDDFLLLPSDSYARSVEAGDVLSECLSHLPLRSQTASLPVRWALFSSSHHVGFADGTSLWLRQGRVPVPPETIDSNGLREAAVAVGLFLLANQAKDGALMVPQEKASPPEEAPAAPGRAWGTPQLYATFALGRLAKATGRKDFAAGFNRALAHAAGRVRQEESFAYVLEVADKEQVAALSFLVLAVQEAPPTPQGSDLCRKLLAMVDKALAVQPPPAEVRPARLAERSAVATARPRLSLKDLALAHLASSRAEPNSAARLRSLRAAMAFALADAEGACWLLRAGLREDANSPSGDPLPWPLPAEGPGELAGSFAPPGRPPDTLVTALCAVNLTARRTWPGLTLPQAPGGAEAARRETVLAARRFCCQMLYKPREAYFADKPELWTGGVRASPQGAKITLAACAAAIEALLAE